MRFFGRLRDWWGKSLRYRLLVSSIATTVVFLTLLGYLSFRIGQASVRREVNQRNDQLSTLAAQDINAHFDNIWGNVRLFTYQLKPSTNMLPLQARAMLEFRRISPLTYRALYLFDGEGQLLIHLADPLEDLLAIQDATEIINRLPISLTDEVATAYEATKNKGLFISTTYIVGADQVPIVYMGIPIAAEQGQSSQIVVAEIDLRDIWRKVDEIRVGQTGRAFVVSRQGTIIAHPDRAYIGQPLAPELTQALAGYEGRAEYTDPVSGAHMLASYSPVGGQSGWAVVVEQERDEAFAPLGRITFITLSVVLVAIVAATMVTILVARSIIRPIQRLAEATRTIAHTGDLGQAVAVKGRDEVGQLAATFNQMIASLRRAEESLAASEALYYSTINAMDDPIQVVNTNLEFTLLNEAFAQWAELVDMEVTDHIGRNLFQVFSFLPDRVRDEYHKVFETGEMLITEETNRVGGRDFITETRKIPVFEDASITRIVTVVRDITERKRAEEALQESERRLWQIVEGSSIPTFVIDEKHTVTHWNKACENLTGVPASEMVGTANHWSPFYPVGRQVMMADLIVDGQAEAADMIRYYGGKYQESALIEGAYEAEDFFPDLGESGKWLFFTATSLRDHQGKIVGAVETLQDITGRKRAAEESKQTLAELADSRMAALNMMADAEKARRMAEQANEEISLLYEASRRLGRTLDPEKVHDTLHHLVSQVMDCDGMFVSSYNPQDDLIRCVYNWHEGESIEVSHLPPISLEPEGYGIQSTVIRTGQPLLVPDYAARLNKVQTSYYVDADGSVVDHVNDDVEQTRSAILVPLKLEGQVRGAIQVSSYRKNAYTEAHARFLESLALQVGVAAQNAFLYRQAQDEIAERARVEEERKSLIAELEAKNAELERFTYTVSHDLKSPLITIKGFMGLLEQDAAAGDSGRMKVDMARISNAVAKMRRLLDELLELSRIGRLVNPPEEVELGELAREAAGLVAGRLAERAAELIIADDLPVIYGDRSRLREVLENLIDNGVKFMGDQPDPRIEIGARRDDEETVFYVRDNGVGVDPRYHEKIFGLFEQLNPKIEGTGVGLAIVKRIVEVHGGRIWVESAGAGQGSTFCFTLPSKSQATNTK